jgi:hypothetical protein
MGVVNNFLIEKHIDKSIFDGGVTTESLRCFEETTKIGINVFYIDERGPKYNRHDYVSIYNNEDHDPMINLGYLEQDDKCHFVLITKLNSIISEKYYSHKKLIFAKCNSIFSNREDLLNHEKIYHSSKELPIIKLPNPDKACIKFVITSESDLKKTIYYPFVCYADFEASTKVVDGKTILVPNSYVILSPDLLLLRDTRLNRTSYLKSYWSHDPEELMRHFVSDLDTLHSIHMWRIDS